MRLWPFCTVLATLGCAQQAAPIPFERAAFEAPPQSGLCRVMGLESTDASVVTEMTVRSDGNWCTVESYQSSPAAPASGPATSLATRPVHGEVDIVRTAGMTYVSYRPAAGYAGAESFVIHNDNLGRSMEIRVTVLN